MSLLFLQHSSTNFLFQNQNVMLTGDVVAWRSWFKAGAASPSFSKGVFTAIKDGYYVFTSHIKVSLLSARGH